MSTIVTRAGKGSALTHAEVDANFTNLNTDKVEGQSSSVDSEIALFSGTGGKTIKRATTTGVLKATSGVISAAVAGTDYAGVSTANTFTNNQVISVNSASDALRITQTGAGNALVVEDDTNPDSTPFVVNASGVLVQGNTTSLTGAYSDTATRLNIGSGFVPREFIQTYSADAFGSILEFDKSRGATAGTQTIVQSADQLGQIRFAGSDGTNLIEAARIGSNVDGTPGTNDMPGRLLFSTTADGANSPTERMRINNAGEVGIGSTLGTAGRTLTLAKNLTGGANVIGVFSSGTAQSDATTNVRGFVSQLSTASSNFTISNLYGYQNTQGTLNNINAGGSITNQIGFIANPLASATFNFGFYSDIAAPTSGITTTGTITSISSSGTTVTVNHNAITYTNGQTVTVTATANATALTSGATCTILTVGTTDFTLIGAASNTVGTSFTATGAGTGTGTVSLNAVGSGKTVAGAASGSFTFTTTTSQTFSAVTVLSGSVTVSQRYNFYANGTASNAFIGSLGIGSAPSTGLVLHVSKNPTGSTFSDSVYVNGTIQSDVTSRSASYVSATSVANASFTLTDWAHFAAFQGTKGASATVTNQYGVLIDSSLTGATNNYGFYSNIASGTGRWNFYANGTAENYLGGNLKIGGTAARATTAGTNQLVLFDGTAPVGTLTNGVSFYSASGEARVMDAAGNSTLLSPHDSATNEWIFHSKHTPTGKVLRIDVEKMLRFINDHFGLDMIQEFTEE